MNDILGRTVRDKITGFAGVAMGRVEYLTGCNQVLVTPKVKADGGVEDSRWFDEPRLVVDEMVERVTLDHADEGNGFDAPAPIR